MVQPNSAATLRLFLLGPPRIARDGESINTGTRKSSALVAFLALTGQVHSREALATLLWPEYEQDRAYANLRRTLWALNKTVVKEWLEVDADTIAFRREAGVWLDVDAFRDYLAECQTHGHGEAKVCSACVAPLTGAVELYRDDFMAGFTLPDSPNFDEWQFFERESLRGELAGALQRLVRYHSAHGDFEPAIAYARRWLALDPLQEPAHRELMRLYAWDDQRAAALRQYRECVRILDQELGVPPEPATTELYEAIQAGQLSPASVPPLGAGVPVDTPMPPEPRDNLPLQPTLFVGRHEELTEIARLLQDPECRLLTLVGPGGVGKSRLALEAAAEQVDSPPFSRSHGVFFVPLAPLSSAEFIATTIADAMGFSFYHREGEDSKRQLLNYLCEKQMLLLLDNFEHLLAGAGLLSEILECAPGVKLLVTSRERLNLQPEWVLEIKGMRYPEDEVRESVEEYSAVQLFLRRARQVDAGFSPSPEEIPDVIRICQLLEGMPLGIELAAAWVKMLSSREIAGEIERGLDFLTTSLRDVPERHRSLRAVCDHSWALLSKEDKHVFQRLSVFRGGFRREAAEHVAGAKLFHLSGLADKSLLSRLPSGRYQVHEVLRQYAAEKLDEAALEKAETQDRHCAFFAAFLEEREADLKGEGQREALDEIAEEIENVRAAWRWAVLQCKVPEMRQAAISLWRFHEMMGLLPEGAEAFGQAAAALESEDCRGAARGAERDIVLGLALAFRGHLGKYLFGAEKGEALLRRGVDVLRPRGRRRELALAILLATYYGLGEGALKNRRLIEESLAIFKETGDRWGVAHCLVERGWLSLANPSEAEQYLQESLAISREIGDRWGLGHGYFILGELAHGLGKFDEAKTHFGESLAVRRQIGDRPGMQISLDYLGYVARESGQYEEARGLHLESLAISKEIGDRLGAAGSLDNLGLVARDVGDYDEAERYLRASLTIREEVASDWEVSLTREHLGDVALARGDYQEAQRLYESGLNAAGASLWGLAMAARGLGEVFSVLGELQQARQHLFAVLESAMQAKRVPEMLDILVGVAQLVDRMGNKERSAELLTYVVHHPGSGQHSKNKAQRLLDDLAPGLSPESLTRAKETAKDRELEELVTLVLKEI